MPEYSSRTAAKEFTQIEERARRKQLSRRFVSVEIGSLKTRVNLSKGQTELKRKHRLSDRQFQEMLEMLDGLTPAERATLKHPELIT